MSKYIGAALTLLVVSGCAKSPNNEGDMVIREVAFTITKDGQQFTTRQPATFHVGFPETGDPTGDLSWAVDDRYSLVIQGPYEQFLPKDLSIDLAKQPTPTALTATLMLDGEVVDSGEVTLEMSKDKLEGSYADGDLAFTGVLSTSCAVAGSSSSGEKTFRDDEKFATAECASVKDDGF